MKPSTRAVVVSIIVTLAMSIAGGGRAAEPVADVAARLVAVGIPGLSAVSAVGARWRLAVLARPRHLERPGRPRLALIVTAGLGAGH